MKSTVDRPKWARRIDAIYSSWGGSSARFGSSYGSKEHGIFVRFVISVDAVKNPPDSLPRSSIYVVKADDAADKTAAMIQAFGLARQEFGEKLAWIAKGDDLTFWRLKKLDHLLSQLGPGMHGGAEPIMAGNLLAMEPGGKGSFLSGGAGFVLNAAALVSLFGPFPGGQGPWDKHCAAKVAKNAFLRRSEDVALSECVNKWLGLRLLDALEGAYQLMNVYDPIRSIRGRHDEWYGLYKANAGSVSPLCCSPNSVTFHYAEASLHLFLHTCDLAADGAELQDFAGANLENWPDHLGGYAKKARRDDAVHYFAIFGK